MKLHLPKVLLAAVIAASACFSQVNATEYFVTKGSDNNLHSCTFKDANDKTPEQNQETPDTNNWKAFSQLSVNAAANHDNVLTFTDTSSSTTSDVSLIVDYDSLYVGAVNVSTNSKIGGLTVGTGKTRSFYIGATGGSYTSSFNRNFSFTPGGSIVLDGSQTWNIADSAEVTLNVSSSVSLAAGSNVSQVGGKVNFSGDNVTGTGKYTVSSGTLANATFASGTTLAVGAGAAFESVTLQNGAVLDVASATFSSETALLSHSNVTLSSGIDVVLNSDVEIGDVFKLYDTNVTIDSIIIDGNNYSAARSITQENGTITFTGFGAMLADMVWAGGDGAWNTSNENWNSATGGNSIAFANGDSVTFDSTATVDAAEGVVVGGMTVSGAETELTLTRSNGGYVQGDVTVTDGATLILATTTETTGLIRGSIDVVNGKLQLDAKDVTGYNGGANSTQNIKIAAGSELLLNDIQNETFAGSLVLNGTMKSIGATTSSRWDLYGGASLTVEDGNNGVIENATLRLRRSDTVITVGNNATLTTAAIDNTAKDNEGNGFFKKEGAGSLIVGGAIDVKGITINGGSVTLNAGGSAGNINLAGGNTSLTFNATSDATAEAPTKYTAGTLGTTSSNNYERNITIAENVEVAAASISNAWGMNALTVNGKLALTGELKFSTGGNNGNGNTIAGTGVITTKTLAFGNVGTYKLNVAELTVSTSSSIEKETQILGGEVSLAALNLTANLRVKGGEVSMTGTTGSGTITADAGIINMVGGTHTLNTLDLSGTGGNSTAVLNLSDSAALSVGTTLWGASSSSINVGEGSSVTASGVKVIGTANATTITASKNIQYGANNADFTITNATVEVAPAAESSTTLGNKIVDSNVTNTGDGELIVSDMTVTDASKVQSALTGDMTVTKLTLASGLSETVAAVTTSGVLTLGSISLDLTDYAAGNYTLVSATGDGSIIWDDTAENALSYTGTLGEGFEASVDFVGSDNKTLQLTISEMVTPGESLITTSVTSATLAEGTTALTLNVDAALSKGSVINVNLIGDDVVDLDAIVAQLTTDDKLTDGKPMVSITLVGTNGVEITPVTMNEVVFIKGETGQNYWGEMVGGQLMYNVNLIPEPASATLSLAALMMLCARRRRRA